MRHKAFKEGKLQKLKQYAKPFSEMQFLPQRLNDSGLKSKNTKTIFVGSMSDIQFWPVEATRKILNVCAMHPQHTFMFLSKRLPFKYYNTPINCMCGLTIDCDYYSDYAAFWQRDLDSMEEIARPFISIEPLLGRFYFKIPDNIELVIVGAMTGKGAVKPKKRWIQSVIDNVPADKIHWKPNIKPYLDEYGIKY